MDSETNPVAETVGLTKSFGPRTVLAGVNLTLRRGEIAALLGPNGAGKTTLIGCLLGFLLPTAGSVLLFGEPAAALRPALRARTGFVPQKMTGFTAFRVGGLLDYIGNFYPTPPGPMPAWLSDWADLDPKARVKALSGGQRQRLSILLAMRHSPDLLILDEPVASLDPAARRDFMAMLARYCETQGRSAVISSHILSDLERMVTRAIFMRRGQVIHDTPMSRFREHTRWLAAPVPGEVLRAALPETLSVLAVGQDGALLVDGWTEAAAAQAHSALGAAIAATPPDLETAFLEMTR
jgi:ABC-2 type transport system ATP-binding protein